MTPLTGMMALRRSELNAAPGPAHGERAPFAGVRVDAAGHGLSASRPEAVPASLARVVAARLDRAGGGGPGAAVVTGLSRVFALAAARTFHEALFRAVWPAFAGRTGVTGAPADYRVKTGVIADGAIPVERYGSTWSFKDLHIDRDAMLFSHLYGPVSGFTGGALLLVDIVPYMRRQALSFDDVFEWSDEATAGSKPVLRARHYAGALAECGAEIGAPGPDEIVFINNTPGAGILHGVTPVSVTDPATFRREYHRCTVKDLRLC
jgi:hypothetical protein